MDNSCRGGPRAIAKSFFRSGTPYNPPCPPLKKGGNYKELQEKSPIAKGGFRQQCPDRKLHARVWPPSPQPSPPEAGGEGVGDVAGLSDHKALNLFHIFPLPQWGRGLG